MSVPFDKEKEEAELAAIHEREEEDLARILSEKYNMHYADLSTKAIDSDALRIIPEEEARAAEAIAFDEAGKTIALALRNPHNPELAKLRVNLKELGYKTTEYLVSQRSLEKGLSRYAELSFAIVSKPGVFRVPSEAFDRLAKQNSSKQALREALDETASGATLERVSRTLEIIFAGALALRASDIHLEPEEARTRLRLRIDGLLTDLYFFDTSSYRQLNSRLKILSGVKLNIADRAQDGRFTLDTQEKQIEMRSSFIPGAYGESIVMRILDPETTRVSYKELGIPNKLLERLEVEIRRANGMLLNTGPTGSGKTTTLYSFLREVYSPSIKIITIEDPIEYHLEGIVQTQVEGDKYTFAEGLRSIVRQDPDVIMVGEIRDEETAGIAIQAALTGHFVFSTVHTNDAAGTFPRLVDLGADPRSFGSAITVAMAQRLVRKLEPETKKERPTTDAEKAMIKKLFATVADKSLHPAQIDAVWEPGKITDEHTGYHGRIGLFEAIFMDDELAAFLRDNPPDNEIRRAVVRQGYLTMAQDGVLKALQGITSLSEVAATVDLPG